MRLLIIGGYGNFGGGVARLLDGAPGLHIGIAGRSLARARAFCAEQAHLEPLAFDRDGDVTAQLGAWRPDVVLDASGPFQAYGGYGVARACLALGAHYLDLADGAAFVAGITEFDAEATARGLLVLSGVSTCPVLTMAVLRRMAVGMTLETVQAGIAPSPHNAMGRSVIAAIAAYAGRPVSRRGGAGRALTETRHFSIAPPGGIPLGRRLFSLVEVPELRALERHWPALREVWFGAGPVPEVLHRAFIALAWLVRLRLLRGLGWLVPLIHAVSLRLRWGAHRGGMIVIAEGRDDAGRRMRREWHLTAEGRDGLLIPAMPAAIVLRRMAAADMPQPGARMASTEVTLAEYEALFSRHRIHSGIRDDSTGQSLFHGLLGDGWGQVAAPIRAMHAVRAAAGRAVVERGSSPLARLIARVMRLPAAAADVPVEVRFDADAEGETWTRRFGTTSFSSRLSAGHGRCTGLLCERFGPLVMGMALVITDGALALVPQRWSLFGLRLPLWLGPRVRALESVRDDRFHFDVALGHPLAGRIIRYRGWLEPAR